MEHHDTSNKTIATPTTIADIDNPSMHGIDKKDIAKSDVLCGKGAHGNHHIGNKHYKDMVKKEQDSYCTAKWHEKHIVAMGIVEQVRKQGGRFLLKNNTSSKYNEVGDKMALEKTKQLFRECFKKRKMGSTIATPVTVNIEDAVFPKSVAFNQILVSNLQTNDDAKGESNTEARQQMMGHHHTANKTIAIPTTIDKDLAMHDIDKKNITTNDVLCGKGAHANHMIGNKHHREMVKKEQDKYRSAKRREKHILAVGIVAQVRRQGGRFLLKNDITNKYNDMGNKMALEKTKQLFRERFKKINKRVESNNKRSKSDSTQQHKMTLQEATKLTTTSQIFGSRFMALKRIE